MSAYEDALAKKSAASARRSKRAEKRASLPHGQHKRAKQPKLPSISKLKKIFWHEISLYVRSWSPVCAACKTNPTQCAAHIVPSKDGAATRFFLPNLYPACFKCNEDEHFHRGQWVKRHEQMFGVDFVDALYAMSRETFQIKRVWLVEQIERIRTLRARAEVTTPCPA